MTDVVVGPARDAAVEPTPGNGTAGGAVRPAARLLALELRVMGREPMVLVSLLGFPVLVMLVIAGVFGQSPDPDFGGVAPDEYYVASYLGVVFAALGLVALPTHIATHRELGVVRRYRASGLSAGTLVAVQVALGLVLGVVSTALVLVVGDLVYGIRFPDNPGGVAAWLAGGLICFVAIGCALGLILPTGRSATAVGNLLFLPTFLLGGGGPPRDVMTGAMQRIADVIPLSHVTGGVREEWLGATDANIVVWWPPTVAVLALAGAAWVARRRTD
jgi:ABC-2 type transport system permease protein